MPIRNRIDALMARFGYVRAPAESEPIITKLKLDVDSSQVSETLTLLEQLTPAALTAEAALAKLWNIQAAMQCRHLYTGAGSTTDANSSSDPEWPPKRREGDCSIER